MPGNSANIKNAFDSIATPPSQYVVKALDMIVELLKHAAADNHSIMLVSNRKDCSILNKDTAIAISLSISDDDTIEYYWESDWNIIDLEKLAGFPYSHLFTKETEEVIYHKDSIPSDDNSSDSSLNSDLEYYTLEGKIKNKNDEEFIAKLITEYLIYINGIKHEDIRAYILISNIYSEDEYLFEVAVNNLGNKFTFFQMLNLTKKQPEIEIRTSTETIIIPDVHGRDFWRRAVENHPMADIIFLGDYLDPYPNEGITPEEAISNFKDIITFAKQHPNCQLLLGNHDLHYLYNFGEACRLDYKNYDTIRQLLLKNMFISSSSDCEALFKIIDLRKMGEKIVVFSHAPILTNWIHLNYPETDLKTIARSVNNLILMDQKQVISCLGQISFYRGGRDSFGSPVWADLNEVNPISINSIADYSVFGHTQQEVDPVVTDRWACLDCRKAFIINSDLEIKELTD